jgi:hypothetical protein
VKECKGPCKQVLDEICFAIRSDNGRLRNDCKSCQAGYYEQYRQKNRFKLKKYMTNYYSSHIDERKIYNQVNKEHIRIVNNIYTLNRLKKDIQFRLRFVLRSRMRAALKDNAKSGSSVENLGCSIPELKAYLESRFQPGMTWQNWSVHGWHIDHKKPLSSFDLTDPEQFRQAVHYTNLQPLWAIENILKGNKEL